MSDLEDFRRDVNQWLEANCPPSMREPLLSPNDLEWGGRAAEGRTDDKKI
jgi:acyl-CoA dehydrogenase